MAVVVAQVDVDAVDGSSEAKNKDGDVGAGARAGSRMVLCSAQNGGSATWTDLNEGKESQSAV